MDDRGEKTHGLAPRNAAGIEGQRQREYSMYGALAVHRKHYIANLSGA